MRWIHQAKEAIRPCGDSESEVQLIFIVHESAEQHNLICAGVILLSQGIRSVSRPRLPESLLVEGTPRARLASRDRCVVERWAHTDFGSINTNRVSLCSRSYRLY